MLCVTHISAGRLCDKGSDGAAANAIGSPRIPITIGIIAKVDEKVRGAAIDGFSASRFFKMLSPDSPPGIFPLTLSNFLRE
jgi:hypothetical protein